MARSAHAQATRRSGAAAPARAARRPRAAAPRRSGRRRRRRAPAPSMPLPLLVFVVCLALLAVGRVTLSFAVVQKNLQTDAWSASTAQLAVENAAARGARPPALSSSLACATSPSTVPSRRADASSTSPFQPRRPGRPESRGRVRDGARRGGRRRDDASPRPAGDAATAAGAAPADRRVLIDRRVRLLRIAFLVAFLLIGGKAIALASTQAISPASPRSQQAQQSPFRRPRERSSIATETTWPSAGAAHRLRHALHARRPDASRPPTAPRR